MHEMGILRKLFSPAGRASFGTAVATAALAMTWEQTAAADGASASPGVATPAPPAGNLAPLPTEKLSCKTGARAPRTPVVLVCCGSFNPPTIMHMRMVDLAGDELIRRGYDVWGAYLSPVADAYGKAGLAPAIDRVAMCRLAAEDEALWRRPTATGLPDDRRPKAASHSSPHQDPTPDLTMVYDWESRQPGYTRTLAVLRRVESELRAWVASGAPAPAEPPAGPGPESAPAITAPEPAMGSATPASHAAPTPSLAFAPGATSKQPPARKPHPPPAAPPPRSQAQAVLSPPPPRAILLCGGDVLASMAVPGVWRDPDVILREHGVVCVAREGTDLERLLTEPGSVLYDYRDRIVVVYDRVGNSVSSSKVRQELAMGRPVRYLVPPSVLSYIFERGLYGTRPEGRS